MGGGFGSIMGRNSFQREHDEAVKLLQRRDGHLQDDLAGEVRAGRESGAGARSAARLISSGAASGPEG